MAGARKAVGWSSSLDGIEGQSWFLDIRFLGVRLLSIRCFTKYVKEPFLRGAARRPALPVESQDKHRRNFLIHEDDRLDEEIVASWNRQASELPG